MDNLLGALIEETEANRFKPQLIEDSEITYKMNKLDEFNDNFTYTQSSVQGDPSLIKLAHAVQQAKSKEELLNNT